jgi:transposase
VEHLVRRDPRPCGLTQTRGTLDAIRSPLAWGRDAALRGIARILDRLGITWQRARSHVHRPDPHYQANLQEIADVVEYARAHPNQVVTVYLDDVTVTRRPTLANGYGRAGADQVRAERSLATDCELRIVGSLDVVTGQVVTRRAKTMGLATLAPFFPDRRAAYPEAERIDVILDNWPVHVHPDVLVALEPQTTRWAFSRPGHWPATPSVRAVRRAGDVRLPIQLMPLPTYASWCNPIEKLWRWMRQEVTRVHRWATDLDQLRNHLDAFFASFATGSSKLLQYVGLG